MSVFFLSIRLVRSSTVSHFPSLPSWSRFRGERAAHDARASVRDRASALLRRKHGTRSPACATTHPPPGRPLACLAAFARLACALGETHAVSDLPRVGSPETAPGGGSASARTGAGATPCPCPPCSPSPRTRSREVPRGVALGAVIGAQREFSPTSACSSCARRTAVAPGARGPAHARPRRARVVPVHGRLLERVRGTGARAGQETPFVAGTFNHDTARVAAQVVSGVGFLGAGTIWRSNFGASE